MRISEIKALMARYGLRPAKSLGQNFLVDPLHLQQIVDAANLHDGETVLEIGPGPGSLTERLLEVAGCVVAVELDKGFVRLLEDRFGTSPNFRLHHQDILATDVPALLKKEGTPDPQQYKCVANIPYYITSAVIRHLLESSVQPQLLVLLVQNEVAQRITARPGDLSLLAVGVQFYGEPEIVDTVSAGAFYPSPKVDSAILRVRPYSEKRYQVENPDLFWAVVRAGFGQKRKQLKNSLNAGLPWFNSEQVSEALAAAGIDEKRRAQTLDIKEWVALYEEVAEVRRSLETPRISETRRL
ncbi:MAG: 16S rRNA (adenine(1518)-N(6)/adenine(1519)-N(6))-dimethyltransferase RsmA [Ardenticatenaceae bacterium]